MSDAPTLFDQTGLEVAVIGMAGRFPGARNVDEFWKNLRSGVESISTFTDEELIASGEDADLLSNPAYIRAGGVIEDAEMFDASFFGFNPREAEMLDPQHRLFLECCWEALENACYDPEAYKGRIGLFAGVRMSSYLINCYSKLGIDNQLSGLEILIGNDKDYLPTRASYKLNLRGPSVNVQSACSTSLVAVHFAVQSLLSGDCEMALAGGVSIHFPQKAGILYHSGLPFSPDGHCRAFDADAQGTISSNGAGLVVLKRLEEALKDRDPIRAVIRGSAVNNDGSMKIGFTAPSIEGQAKVVRAAQIMAEVDAETIGYVETHGTGTPLGDPIEVAALTQAFRASTQNKGFCAIGSLKTNVGHMDAAAGVAGLIKTALALENKLIPPSLNFERPNPKIDFQNSPFYVNTSLSEWNANGSPRRAGVNSFGLGGTNAHVILEEPPPIEDSGDSRPWQLLLLSARTRAALEAATSNLAAHINEHPDLKLADIAYTLQVGRRHFRYRGMIVCQDKEAAVTALESGKTQKALPVYEALEQRSVIFMFPGGGNQYPGMGSDLYQTEPVFREQVDLCSEILEKHLGCDLRESLFPPVEKLEQAAAQLKGPMVLPALFTIEYALAKLWMSRGVYPDAMIGHSLGEYVAACLSGVFRLEDALAVTVLRGRLLHTLPESAMLIVLLPEREVRALMSERLSIGAINGPAQCMVAGPADAIDELRGLLSSRGAKYIRVQTGTASHCQEVDNILDEFVDCLKQLTLNAPTIPYISNVTGTWITAEQAMSPSYWATHLRQTVRFADGVGELLKEPNRILLEVGPGHTLSTLAKIQIDKARAQFAFPSMRHLRDQQSELAFILTTLGHLWSHGVVIDWQEYYANERRNRVQLPSYPFERRRYWIELRKDALDNSLASALKGPRLSTEPYINVESSPTDEPDGQQTNGSRYDRPPMQSVYVAAGNRLEEKMVALWQDVFNIEPVGIHDNFFELGGNSLLAIQLVSRVREVFGINVEVRDLFEATTVASLTAIIQANLQPRHTSQASALSPAPRNGPLPLSFAQQRMWFLNQMQPGSPLYNVATALRLTGELNTTILERALNEIVRRHEVLRTSFVSERGEPVQVIAPSLTLTIPITDLSHIDKSERQREAAEMAAEMAQEPFDLSRSPLLRVSLLRLDEGEHVVVLAMHHIICDGWSSRVLAREIAALYEAFSAGKGSPLPELTLQYADYARWQREWLQGEELERQMGYWKKQLAGAPSALELPTDRPRPAVPSHKGASNFMDLPMNVVESLRALSRQEGTTQFMTLLSAFKALLCRYTGHSDIVVGTPIANRNRVEVEPLIGMFVNTLVLRTDLSSDPSFQELLGRVREVTLGAYAHEDLPFEKLVEDLQPEREMSRSPLFQVMFLWEDATRSVLDLPGLKISFVEGDIPYAKFDLVLTVLEQKEGLSLWLNYNTDLFDDSTVEHFLKGFSILLESCLDDPRQRISTLPVMTRQQRDRLLTEWNDTTCDYERDECIHKLFERQVEETPDALAVVFEDERLTYRELNTRANRVAHYLRGLGCGPEALVGVCMERSPRIIISILGILKAGAAYLFLDPSYPGQRLGFMLEEARVSVLLADERLAGPLADIDARVIYLDSEWETIELESSENPASNVTSSNLAYMIYTSGSTGNPKGVLIEHRGVINLVEALQRPFNLRSDDRVLQFASFSFDASVSEVFPHLLKGSTIWLASKDQLLPGNGLTRLIREKEITMVTLPPSALAVMSPQELPALRTIVVAGEACSPDIVRRWAPGRALINAYGPTEVTVASTATTCDEAGSKVHIGRPLANTRVYILDENLQPASVGMTGELYITGAGIARGYHNRPEITAEKFIPNPFSEEPGGRLYRTGDHVRYMPDGNIEFIGRIDHQVKIRGFRIELGEIENALARHPSVSNAGVLAIDDGSGNKRLVACVARAASQSPSPAELRNFLARSLPEFMVPSAFVLLDQLPLTTSGKVDRAALVRLEDYKSGSETAFVAPRTPIEHALVKIWSEVLRMDRIGVDDDFFELGGHSLLATRVISQVQEALRVEIPLRSIFEKPTVAKLAELIEFARLNNEKPDSEHWTKPLSEQVASTMVELKRGSSERILFLIPPMGRNALSFYHLARMLGSDLAVYGMQPRGLDGAQEPFASIEQEASFYLKAMRALQPEGPYYLGGASFGGVVAYEIAQQMRTQGQGVSLLALLDTPNPIDLIEQPVDDATLVASLLRGMTDGELAVSADELRKLDGEHLLSYVQGRLGELGKSATEFEISQARSILRVGQANMQAMFNYKPKAYPGRLIFFRASERSGEHPHNPELPWIDLAAGGIEIHVVPGNHFSMLDTPNVEALAQPLSRCLVPGPDSNIISTNGKRPGSALAAP